MLQVVSKKTPADLAGEILKEVGDITGHEVMFNNVLVAIYVSKTVGSGLLMAAPQSQQESIYQGVCGLVLAKGPTAFVDDGVVQFHGHSVEVGDWVVYRSSDGHRIEINGVECRLIPDQLLKMRVAHPHSVR